MDSEIDKYCDPTKLPKVHDMEIMWDEMRHNKCMEEKRNCLECDFYDCIKSKGKEVIENDGND